jgi:hypothetical protein
MDEVFEFAVGRLDPSGGEAGRHESSAPHVHGCQVRHHEFGFSELLQFPGTGTVTHPMQLTVHESAELGPYGADRHLLLH